MMMLKMRKKMMTFHEISAVSAGLASFFFLISAVSAGLTSFFLNFGCFG